jgi:hypothetical protein
MPQRYQCPLRTCTIQPVLSMIALFSPYICRAFVLWYRALRERATLGVFRQVCSVERTVFVVAASECVDCGRHGDDDCEEYLEGGPQCVAALGVGAYSLDDADDADCDKEDADAEERHDTEASGKKISI